MLASPDLVALPPCLMGQLDSAWSSFVPSCLTAEKPTTYNCGGQQGFNREIR